MKKGLYLVFILLVSFFSCQHNTLKQQLVEIDSLSFKQNGDSIALEMLEKIAPETIEDEECLAYYWLLKIRTEIRMDKNIKSADPLNVCINYYEKHRDAGKLARAYGYKAQILADNNRLPEASAILKKAEALVKDNPKELKLQYNIYSLLYIINGRAGEINLGILYGKKALETAYKTHDEENIIYSYMALYVLYKETNHMDSALYYLNKCIPVVEKIPVKDRLGFYVNIGNSFLAQGEYETAEKYLQKGLQDTHNIHAPFAYRGLARVYYIRGEREKAEQMWQKALQSGTLYTKEEVLQAMYEAQRDQGDYKAASATAMHLVALKDTIARKRSADDIKGIQERFEQEEQSRQREQQIQLWGTLILIVLLAALSSLIYLKYLHAKSRRQLADTQQQLVEYRERLAAVRQAGKADEKEVERLTQKIDALQQKQGALLANGRARYEEIEAGGTTLRWSRSDFSDCVEYYRTLDAAFVRHMETDFRHLSPKYIFFALLEHTGRTDEDIQRIMAISQSTVRSNRSRINSSRLEEP